MEATCSSDLKQFEVLFVDEHGSYTFFVYRELVKGSSLFHRHRWIK